MKLFPFVILLFWLHGGYAKGKPFPGIDYSYAKVYLFNLNTEPGVRPESHVVEGNHYAASKIGNGYELSQQQVEQFNSLLGGDVNVLRIGLSKCFIPRHGVVYFNENHQAVASVSICFECGMIKVWSPDYKMPPLNYKKVNEQKALKQLKFIREQIFGDEIPFYENPNDYQTITQKWEEDYYGDATEMEFENPDTLTFKAIDEQKLKQWLPSEIRLKEELEEKITAGGDRYSFKKWTVGESTFLFWDNADNALLANANIVTPGIVLTNGISIGMSSEQILKHYNYFEKGISPDILFVKGTTTTIEFYFKYNTLNQIKINLNQ